MQRNQRSFTRTNFKIRVPRVRCINADGEMVGVLATRDALKLAQDQGMDLVEVSPNADPPVCRVMDFGKFQYMESLKRKQARKNVHRNQVKEIKFHASVGEHDYQTKVQHIHDFLGKGHKVKVSLMFRGRENAHRELGFEVVDRVVKDCAEIGTVDQAPRLIGRNIICLIGAKPAKSPQK